MQTEYIPYKDLPIRIGEIDNHFRYDLQRHISRMRLRHKFFIIAERWLYYVNTEYVVTDEVDVIALASLGNCGIGIIHGSWYSLLVDYSNEHRSKIMREILYPLFIGLGPRYIPPGR